VTNLEHAVITIKDTFDRKLLNKSVLGDRQLDRAVRASSKGYKRDLKKTQETVFSLADLMSEEFDRVRRELREEVARQQAPLASRLS
jgi:hypothetical protein